MHRMMTAAAMSVVVASLAIKAQAQEPPPPVGMVDDPCPALQPPPSAIQTDEERQAARQAYMRRMMADWGGLCRYRAANAALAGGPAPRAVFMGDSITEFWGGARPDLFSNGLVNRGIGGQTTPQMVVRFQQDVIALRPAIVHIMAGTNDLAGNTGPNRPEDFRNNIRAMTQMARANGIAVVLGAIPPAASFPWRPEVSPAPRIAELNAWLRAYAQENGFVFVDYHAAMTGPSGELPAALSGDGVHPDDAGYAVMTPLAVRALEAALAPSADRTTH